MKTKLVLLAGLSGLLMVGCASPHVRSYQGAQEDWPTSPGAMVDSSTVIPVYYGNPPRAYSVIGEFESSGPIQYTARQGRTAGADAIIVKSQTREASGSTADGLSTGFRLNNGVVLSSGVGSSTVEYKTRIVATLIRWK